MSHKITPDVVAAQLAALGSSADPCTIDRLAEALGVAASHGALRHAIAELAERGKLARDGAGGLTLTGITTGADTAPVRELYACLLDMNRDGTSSNDVVQAVDDWLTSHGYPTILYRT